MKTAMEKKEIGLMRQIGYLSFVVVLLYGLTLFAVSCDNASLVAPGTLRTASLQYIRHPAPKMHITNVHRPPKKCTFVKRRQSFRSPYILQHKNKILHILTRGKIALKKRFAHFFSVSHFPFSKCTFSSRF